MPTNSHFDADSLIARNVELEAENARLREELSALNETLKLARQGAELVFQQLKESEANAEVQFQARKVIEEQLAAAQLDAARYRWLRDECVPEKHPNHTWIVEAPGDMWDAAIDSAMKGEQS